MPDEQKPFKYPKLAEMYINMTKTAIVSSTEGKVEFADGTIIGWSKDEGFGLPYEQITIRTNPRNGKDQRLYNFPRMFMIFDDEWQLEYTLTRDMETFIELFKRDYNIIS